MNIDYMNWDTNELFLWFTNDERHYKVMKRFSRTAKEFKRQGNGRLKQINNSLKSKRNEEDWINGNEIQWNDLYIAFCDVIGNENPKMNL